MHAAALGLCVKSHSYQLAVRPTIKIVAGVSSLTRYSLSIRINNRMRQGSNVCDVMCSRRERRFYSL